MEFVVLELFLEEFKSIIGIINLGVDNETLRSWITRNAKLNLIQFYCWNILSVSVYQYLNILDYIAIVSWYV